MKDYLRQKSKYLPLISKWVKEHGGQATDIIPFSVEFEEKVASLQEDKEKLAEFLKESKVKSRLPKIISEGSIHFQDWSVSNIDLKFAGFLRLGLQYYFTGFY